MSNNNVETGNKKKTVTKKCTCEPNYRNPRCCEHGDTCNLH